MTSSTSPTQSPLPLVAVAVIVVVCVGIAGWLVYAEIQGSGSASPDRAKEDPSTSKATLGVTPRNAPPVPYRFAGTKLQGGVTWYLLEKDGVVHTVGPGTIIDRDYRVDVSGTRGIALIYLPTGERQGLSMNQAAWPPQAGNTATPLILNSPVPSAVNRTTSPALQELAR